MIPRLVPLILLVCVLGGCAVAPRSTEPPTVGAVAPDFTLPELDGSMVKLTDLRGSVVVVNFWATWCGPCVEETPRLVRWHEQYKADGLQVLGVNALVRDSRDEVAAFVQDYHVTYPLVVDSEGDVVAQWLAQQMPRSYVLDRAGVLRFARIGAITEEDFQQHIQPLLAEQ
jgi:cytochrome c biogenesis protein CcmG/thiol:disulfide interchange protein DsbE